jgi:RNase P subunit RPR2
MQAIAAIHSVIADNDFDGEACPKCSTLIAEPKSSDYRGLGRIEHSWQCTSCGDKFKTTARMAGVDDFEQDEAAPVAA